jgi:GntR family transcriptional regulator
VIRIDLDSPRALEEQLATELRLALARGEVAPGDELPSARQLAGDLGVHWNTVARVYRRLNDEGLITVRHGRRTLVARRSAGSTTAPAARESLRAQLVEAMTIGRLRGLSYRDINDVFKDALVQLQEKRSS